MSGQEYSAERSIIGGASKKFARDLKIDNFNGSNGWLDGFKKRNDICFRKICGESKDVDEEVCSVWLEELPRAIEDYCIHDIYNADETALYFKCLPDKTLAFRTEDCKGGKHSKERVTILLGSNVTGDSKLPPLMIGKSANPRCFKNVKSRPMAYNETAFYAYTSSIKDQLRFETGSFATVTACTAVT